MELKRVVFHTTRLSDGRPVARDKPAADYACARMESMDCFGARWSEWLVGFSHVWQSVRAHEPTRRTVPHAHMAVIEHGRTFVQRERSCGKQESRHTRSVGSTLAHPLTSEHDCRYSTEKGMQSDHGLRARAPDTAQPIRPSRLPQLPEAARKPLWVSRNAPHPGPESLGLRRASQASPLVRKEVVVKLGWGTLGFQVLTPTPSSPWLPTTRGDDLGATICPPACLAPRCDCDPRCQATATWTFLVRRRKEGYPLTHSYQAVAGTCAGRDALVPGSRQPPTPHLQLPPAASPADRDG